MIFIDFFFFKLIGISGESYWYYGRMSFGYGATFIYEHVQRSYRKFNIILPTFFRTYLNLVLDVDKKYFCLFKF